ncbi:MAG: UvrD-helicase domain-containing protein, partial [Candidatus Neomarinimicrobiota bacterium]
MIEPNKSQNAAIRQQPSPLMILAGAGTGKTFTLQNRIVHLINYYEVNPKHILAITYTEKAAKELKGRIINQIGSRAQTMTVSTFHSFCFKILKEFGNDTLPQLLEESEAIHLILEKFDSLGPFQSDEFPLNPKRAINDSFIPFFNRVKDELIDLENISIPKP